MIDRPTHSLEGIQAAISDERYAITDTAARNAGDMGFGESDICRCVLGLGRRNFYKGLVDRLSLVQDVYKTSLDGEAVYLKLRIDREGKAVVISFKADESPEKRYGQNDE